MAEWFKAAVLKIAVGLHPTGGSNPSLSAINRLKAEGLILLIYTGGVGMPVYEFKCNKCGEVFSITMSIKEREKAEITCPKCKSKDLSPVYSNFYAVTSKKS